ncbi:MAG: cell envelope integrity protein TolA, partial [Gammaproteobacteria bacterium]|nr:cell envelope integrity protein TolA [Gammaproteobacteria bacterium]
KKRQAELKRKEQRDRAERERRSKGIINRHVALIVQKIERNWRQPLDAPSGLVCKIEIMLLPSGNVVSVKIIESSGNQAFDRSVETAVRKASPLPVPTDSVIFKEFEVMRLRFEPGSY